MDGLDEHSIFYFFLVELLDGSDFVHGVVW